MTADRTTPAAKNKEKGRYVPAAAAPAPHNLFSRESLHQPAGWQPPPALSLPGASWLLPSFGACRWGIAQRCIAQSQTLIDHTCAVDRTSELDDISSLPRLYSLFVGHTPQDQCDDATTEAPPPFSGTSEAAVQRPMHASFIPPSFLASALRRPGTVRRCDTGAPALGGWMQESDMLLPR